MPSLRRTSCTHERPQTLAPRSIPSPGCPHSSRKCIAYRREAVLTDCLSIILSYRSGIIDRCVDSVRCCRPARPYAACKFFI